MASSSVYLSGGPCDGKIVSANQIVGGAVAYIKCGGGYYILDDGATHQGADVVFKWAGKAQPGPPPGPGVKAAKAHGGWADMQTSVNRHMPAALRTAHRNTEAALRSLGRARKVRL